jgi:hypothetical protein
LEECAQKVFDRADIVRDVTEAERVFPANHRSYGFAASSVTQLATIQFSGQKHLRQVLVSSIKEEVKKKHISSGWSFSCFSAHLIELDLF